MKTTYIEKIKKIAVIGLAAMTAMLSAAALSGCGCEKSSKKTATADEATPDTTYVVETLGQTDQAVIDAGLTVNEKGNIVDKNGNEVKVSEDGKVEVKTADGKTVKVDAQEVKTANENKVKVDQINEKAEAEAKADSGNGNNANNNTNNNNQNNGSGNNAGNTAGQTSKNTQTSKTTQTSQSSQTNKPAQTSQTSKPAQSSQSSQSSQTSKPSQSSQSSSGGSSGGQSSQTQTSTDPHAGKTWHEAVYKTVNHPAETQQVWVVDVPAHEETVTETQRVYVSAICAGCGAVMDSWSDSEIMDHAYNHRLNGEANGYRSGFIDKEVEKTIHVEEQGHYETQVVRAAWSEQVLVKAAGWY